MNTSKKLNKQQLQAVKHNKGPLLIIAGAGTGKTTVITERIKNIINKGYAKPEEILALTFTEKAATEMESRVDEVMPLSYGNVWVMTFHSFCDQILRESGLHIGLPSNFKLMTKEKSVDLFKRNLFNFSLDYFRPLGNPNKFIYSLLTHFSRLQDELVTPAKYLNWVKSEYKTSNSKQTIEEKLEHQKWQELAKVYKEYDELKLKEGKFDFGDLVIKTVELFTLRPNILSNYQKKFKYILVDEFQDTNYGQNELVNLLASKHKNITVVADDNQSIYAFRGAAVNNVLSFKEVYPQTKIITLNQNYRSTQKILDGSYKLIKNNDPDTLEVRMGISKKLISQKKGGSNIDYKLTENGGLESERVSEIIAELVEGNNYEYKDIAILVRANSHADIFIKEFERQGIPHQFLGPSSLFVKEEIVDLISYLKSLYDPEDSESFYRLLSSKYLKIDHSKIISLLGTAKKESRSLYEVFITSNLHSKIKLLLEKHLSELSSKLTGEILYELLTEMGIYEQIIKDEEEIKAKNISTFFQKIKTFENENPQARLREVVDYLNLLSEVGETPQVTNEGWQENNAVNLLTVHSSKGLEFPVVFMVNLISDRFPSRNRGEDLPIPEGLINEKVSTSDFHLQEERRLFYVGMTRAKERLYLTGSKYYNDDKREKKISPFVMEVLGEEIEIGIQNNVKKDLKHEINQKRIESFPSTVKVNYLSVSQIETFETCPLHYQLKYIYKLPTPKSASISFGISVHETLRQIYMLLKSGDRINNKKIIDIYKSNFINEGFENKKHKEQFLKKGEHYVLEYFANKFNTKILPDRLEERFTINLSKDLKIGGTIDRVDRVSKSKLEIIDYKTGEKIPTQKEVDKDLQLSVYCLAVTQMYNVKPEDVKLSFYYFDKQQKISTTRTEKDLEEVKQKLFEYKSEIEKSDFKCSDSYFCQMGCEFKMFCSKD